MEWPLSIKELKSGFFEGERSKFIDVYNQSLEAEIKGLDEIAGMGFRKSLEILVKDFVSLNVSGNEREAEIEKIKSMLF